MWTRLSGITASDAAIPRPRKLIYWSKVFGDFLTVCLLGGEERVQNRVMPKSDGWKNLKDNSQRTPEERRTIGQLGGKASVKARQQKKLMSQIYAEFLAEKFYIKLDPWDPKCKPTAMTGESLVNHVVKEVLNSGGSASVSLLKELREATEGNKLAITDPDGGPFGVMALSHEDAIARLAALKKKQDAQ
jgi:hypothetical protein